MNSKKNKLNVTNNKKIFRKNNRYKYNKNWTSNYKKRIKK